MKQLSLKQIEEAIITMKESEVMLVNVRPVSGEKFTIEFAEKINNPTSNSLLGSLNFDDSRFTSPKARRGWSTASKKGLKTVFGIDVDELKSVETNKFSTIYPIGMMNPQTIQGKSIRLKVTDRLGSELNTDNAGDAWKIENLRESAKHSINKQGVSEYFLFNNELIFSDVTPTDASEFEQNIIQRTGVTTEPESYIASSFILAKDEKVEVEEKEKVSANTTEAEKVL